MLFPWHERVSGIMITLLVIHWLWDRDLIEKIKSIKLVPFTLLCWSFFLLHLLGLLHSNYIPEGLQSIEVKMSFFILPLLFSTEHHLTAMRRQYLEVAFVLSCILSFIYCIIHAFIVHPSVPLSAIFHRMTISEAIMHPGYYSNYFAFALVIMSFRLLNKTKKTIQEISLYVFAILFLLFALLILISKTAILFLFLFLFFYLWETTFFLKNVLYRMIGFAGVIAVVSLLLVSIPRVKYRIDETINNLNHMEKAEVTFSNSTGSRKVAWGLEWQMIKQKPIIGFGTGAANPLLLQSFKDNGYENLAMNNMHTHNQVLHTWLDLGLIGVLLLIVILGLSGYLFLLLRKDNLGLWMIVLIIANILTDDILEIQAGIVFFMFFWILYLFKDQVPKRKLHYTY
jgi:O-antigen ligase